MCGLHDVCILGVLGARRAGGRATGGDFLPVRERRLEGDERRHVQGGTIGDSTMLY